MAVSRCCLFWEPGRRRGGGPKPRAPSQTLAPAGPRCGTSQAPPAAQLSCADRVYCWGQSWPLAKKGSPGAGPPYPCVAVPRWSSLQPAPQTKGSLQKPMCPELELKKRQPQKTQGLFFSRGGKRSQHFRANDPRPKEKTTSTPDGPDAMELSKGSAEGLT